MLGCQNGSGDEECRNTDASGGEGDPHEEGEGEEGEGEEARPTTTSATSTLSAGRPG